MAAPNYEQIQSFGNVSDELRKAAVSEFADRFYEGMPLDEVIAAATEIAARFSLYGSELGAQWYDLCSRLAGYDVDEAELVDPDLYGLSERARLTAEKADTSTSMASVMGGYLQNVVNDSIRQTGRANLWRDYERGLVTGRWSRVPVGDTCAWCLMLASQGAWYLSEKSALEGKAGRYHSDCNCVAVYHADPESINGYSKLPGYKRKYYDADNKRRANNDPGNDYEYPEELARRVATAKAEHMAKFHAGDTDAPWTVYNEDLIVMRYEYGLK